MCLCQAGRQEENGGDQHDAASWLGRSVKADFLEYMTYSYSVNNKIHICTCMIDRAKEQPFNTRATCVFIAMPGIPQCKIAESIIGRAFDKLQRGFSVCCEYGGKQYVKQMMHWAALTQGFHACGTIECSERGDTEMDRD